MKLIFINRYFHPDHSATSQMLSGIAFGLAKGGSDVRVITSRLRYDSPDELLFGEEVIDGVCVRRVWTSRFGRSNLAGRAIDYATFYLTAAWALWRMAREGDVIVAKTDPPMLSVMAAPIARWRRARLVNWLQDIFPEVATGLGMARGGVAGQAVRLLKRCRDRSLMGASANVVLGERMAALVAGLGVPEDKIRIIPNWADGRLVHPINRSTNELRRDWGLGDAFVVGYSGNLGRAHDVATMLDAIERTGAGHAQATTSGKVRGELAARITWLFIGGGAQFEAMRTEADRRGLTSIVFKPYQPSERLAQSLSVADVHLISLRPSLEGLIVPSKYYGVAAAGRPGIFIGDSDGEIARALTRSGTGKVVAEGDGEGLAAAVLALAADPVATQSKGEVARRVFEAQYDLPIALAAWQRLLGEVGADC